MQTQASMRIHNRIHHHANVFILCIHFTTPYFSCNPNQKHNMHSQKGTCKDSHILPKLKMSFAWSLPSSTQLKAHPRFPHQTPNVHISNLSLPCLWGHALQEKVHQHTFKFTCMLISRFYSRHSSSFQTKNLHACRRKLIFYDYCDLFHAQELISSSFFHVAYLKSQHATQKVHAKRFFIFPKF